MILDSSIESGDIKRSSYDVSVSCNRTAGSQCTKEHVERSI
jgi:hypothetical protein